MFRAKQISAFSYCPINHRLVNSLISVPLLNNRPTKTIDTLANLKFVYDILNSKNVYHTLKFQQRNSLDMLWRKSKSCFQKKSTTSSASKVQQPKLDKDYAKLVESIYSPNLTMSDTSENASSVVVNDKKVSAKEMMKEILGRENGDHRKSDGDEE